MPSTARRHSAWASRSRRFWRDKTGARYRSAFVKCAQFHLDLSQCGASLRVRRTELQCSFQMINPAQFLALYARQRVAEIIMHLGISGIDRDGPLEQFDGSSEVLRGFP
jgi:hypothetical protein